MRGHQGAFAAQHAGQDLLHVVRQRARQRVLEAFAAGRRHVIGTAPDQHLLLAPLLAGVILVETGQIAIVALVQRQVLVGLQPGLAELGEHQIERVLSAGQRRGEGDVEGETLRFQLLAGGLGFGDTEFGEVGILPAREQVLQVPVALAMPHEHEETITHSLLSGLRGSMNSG